MKTLRNLSLSAATLVLASASVLAQAPAPASVHGTVTNAAGSPVKEGVVKLTTDRTSPDDKTRKYQYTAPVGADGSYKIDGVAPGDYVLFYQVNEKTVDYLDHVVLKAGDNIAANDDMTRQEYLSHLSPEERKNIEEFKKRNSETAAANKQIGNLNALLTKAREEEKTNPQSAVDDMKQATATKADEPVLWLEQGNAELALAKTDTDASKKTQDYADAGTAFQKAIDTNGTSKKPNPAFAGAAYNGLGQVYGATSKPKDATDSFDKAAQAEPAKAGMYYFNAAVTLKNAGSNDEAAAMADKAIAADPTKADAYYIKGASLIGKSSMQGNKLVPPPGCVEAYNKYLELAPTGRFAPEVKGILAEMDQSVVNSYKAGKKR
ncbi:hypothetical protein [Terriglobus aquaticus]|uniref:Rhamnogalacturonan lyase domain-containing protein n=1 Tax=Terriglobus aquaticus TaxID=940139 RepID=A0ABW9KQE9_9BACT|nr:hypothetical protein [Terriglobus aquaticus]